MGDDYIGQIDETTEHICGLIEFEDHCYTLVAPEDDPVEREYSVHMLYDDKAPDTALRLLVAREEMTYEHQNTSIHRTVDILDKARGRSAHFAKLVTFGRVKRLVFGEDGDQQIERDPEWRSRPCAIVQYDGAPLGMLLTLAPGGVLGVRMALLVGLGCVRALASLHRLGFVYRQVSPYTISFPNPLSYDGLESGLLLTDLSLVLKWPCKPRTYVPFVGTVRYSSLRTHRGREQGPADDVISVIYMVAEFISGRLPWRSTKGSMKVYESKRLFYLCKEFKRLPKEIRGVYRLMHMTSGMAPIDHKEIIKDFQKAIDRRGHSGDEELAQWAQMPDSGF